MHVIECDRLTKSFGKINALNQFSIQIEENKITGLIGRNGAGKTTLLKILAGFSRQTTGEVKVFSKKPFNNLKVSSNMILIDDHMIMPEHLNLSEILEVTGSFYENWDGVLAQRLFDYFSLNPKSRYLSLSKGMKSTFNMIIGLSARCALTIFDEPTTGMDAAVRKDFYRALLKDYIKFPRSFVISSHLLNEIEDILEDIVLIRDGSLHLHIPSADLKNYAIGLNGNTGTINQSIENNEVLFKKNLGKDSSYVVIKNSLSESTVQILKASGIDITPIEADDLCVYLTSKGKGGIDDVFN